MGNRAFLSIIAALLLFSCNQNPTPPAPPVPVNLFTVKARKVTYYDQYPGTTVGISQVDLHGQVQGYITGIYFKEGAHVYKGQKLYTIDESLYKAAYDQALANLRVAQGNLALTQQDADRYEYLNTYNAIAKQVLDHQIIALKNAKDSVAAAEQEVKTAQTNLQYCEIDAPFAGTIGISQVRLGNLVTIGSTTLNTISTDDPIGVDILVDEAHILKFENLQNQVQRRIDSLFTMVLPDRSLYPQLGKIYIIDRAVDPQTGTIRVRLSFPNPHFAIRVGMSCVVRVHNQEETPQLVVPSRAVIEQMGEYFVYVAKDTSFVADTTRITAPKSRGGQAEAPEDTASSPKLRALERKVTLGATIGPNVIVLSGINEGDQIVVDGIQSIHDGSAINPAPFSARRSGARPDSAAPVTPQSVPDTTTKR